MQTLSGTPRHPGVAIAVAVGVNTESGFDGVPQWIVSQGLRALKKHLPAWEQPEIVMLCDNLSLGATVRLPGVRTIGIAAATDDLAVLPTPVPCVSGVSGLPRTIDDGLIVIVDGDAGLVHLDPDVQTVIRYQTAMEKESAERVFLESAHIPARTQDGRTVVVAAIVSKIDEAEIAVSQGADMLFVHLDELVRAEVSASRAAFVDPETDVLEVLLALCAGKPTVIAAESSKERLERIVRRFGVDYVEFVSQDDLPEVTPREEAEAAVLSGADRIVVRPTEVADTKELIKTLPAEEIDAATDDHNG